MQNWKITYHSISKGKTTSTTIAAENKKEAEKAFDKKHPALYTIIKIESVKM